MESPRSLFSKWSPTKTFHKDLRVLRSIQLYLNYSRAYYEQHSCFINTQLTTYLSHRAGRDYPLLCHCIKLKLPQNEKNVYPIVLAIVATIMLETNPLGKTALQDPTLLALRKARRVQSGGSPLVCNWQPRVVGFASVKCMSVPSIVFLWTRNIHLQSKEDVWCVAIITVILGECDARAIRHSRTWYVAD